MGCTSGRDTIFLSKNVKGLAAVTDRVLDRFISALAARAGANPNVHRATLARKLHEKRLTKKGKVVRTLCVASRATVKKNALSRPKIH